MPPVHYRLGGFPPDARLDWPTLIPLLGPAAAAVARYDGVLAAVPHPSVLLAPLATQEAVLSSRIEGTRATMGEVLEYEAGRQFESPALLGDIDEILNYRLAMRRAETSLQELPLCLRVIREAHKVLLDGVRGRDKAPGELRRIPNWIGPPGCAIADATFVPVGAEELPRALSRWERYLHEDPPDRLVQLAILHAEFEALHPFLDGNGRLGRMLVRWLFGRPVFRSTDFAALAGLPSRTAHRLLRGLLEENVLKTVADGNGRRATVLGFPALLELVEGRKVL